MNKKEIDQMYHVVCTLKKAKVREVERATKELAELAVLQQLLIKCIEVFRSVANNRREVLKARLERLLSYGLQVVFEEPLKLIVEYKKWGASDRVYLNVDDGYVINEIQRFRGGGLVEVTSFLVRLLVLVLYKPNQRRLFMADEAFGAISYDHLAELSRLLQELTKKLNTQLLLVTHNPALHAYADRIFSVRKVEGQSRFTLVV